MSKNRMSTLRLGGLITEPNEYGVYPPGACKVANNVLFRSIGNVDTATDVGVGYAVDASGQDIYHQQALRDGSQLWFCCDQVSGATSIVSGTQLLYPLEPLTSLNELFNRTWMRTIVMRDRIFVNGVTGVYCIDSTAPTSTTRVRRCGLPQPTVYSFSSDVGTVIPGNTVVGYRAVLRRKLGDYEIVSPPSSKVRFTNYLDRRPIVFATSHWVADVETGVEYTLDLYRSQGLNVGTAGVILDRELLQVIPPDPYSRVLQVPALQSTAISTPDGTNRSYYISEYQQMEAPYYESVGQGLYTDDSNEGPLSINFAPPGCKVMGSWNDQAFYGNVQDPPELTFQVPGGLGDDSSASAPDGWGAQGVGSVSVSGTFTSGSPTMTVSSTDAAKLAVGQRVTCPTAYPAGWRRLVGISGTTITLSANSTATTTASAWVHDILSINGVEYAVSSPGYILLLTGVGNIGGTIDFFSSRPADELNDFRPIDITLRAYDGKSFTIKATRGYNYSPPLPEWDETAMTVGPTQRPNILKWSKPDEPEAVPLGNSTSVGSGEILGFESTKDSAFVFCSDGIYQLVGYSNNFQLVLVAKDYVVSSPKATCSMLDRCFAISNRGLIEVTAQGVSELSNGIFDPQSLGAGFSVAGPAYQESDRLQLHADPTHRELVLLLKGSDSTQPSQLIVYNLLTKAFSTVQLSNPRVTSLGYNPQSGTPGELGHLWVASRDSISALPKVAPWSNGAPLQPTVLLQPFYGQADSEAFTSKKWCSVEWLFERPTVHPVVQGFYENLDQVECQGTMKPSNDMSKIRLGVPRSLARRRSIGPGFSIPDPAEAYTLKGCSVTYSPVNLKGDKT